MTPPPASPEPCYAIDRETIETIARTAEKVDGLTKAVDTLTKDVKELRDATSLVRGKIAAVVAIASIIAGWIGSLLPSVIGSRP